MTVLLAPSIYTKSWSYASRMIRLYSFLSDTMVYINQCIMAPYILKLLSDFTRMVFQSHQLFLVYGQNSILMNNGHTAITLDY